ncbi:MAG: SDR family oxidoreductase [Nannocystaceae bacterium]|nr:SDR family oxidoreductase [Nannocystaceae bacterium]
MSLLGIIKGTRGASGFGYASTAQEVTQGIDLTGKRALITGVNSGLGFETARVLAMRGCHIVGAARSEEKAKTACEAIGSNTTPVVCELSDLQSVRRCVDTVLGHDAEIDLLICNAGIMALPTLQQKHGIELQFFTNHVGHFTLATGLLDRLSETARVVMLSSYGHTLAPKDGIEFDNLSGEDHYSRWRNYGQSKLANLLFAVELARRFSGTKKTANALHPGVIRTSLSRHMGWVSNAVYAATGVLYCKTVAQGAATTCYVASSPAVESVSGRYFVDCNEAASSAHGRDGELAQRLWGATQDIVDRVLAEA